MNSEEELNKITKKLFDSSFEQDVCSYEKRDEAKAIVKNIVNSIKIEESIKQKEEIQYQKENIEKVKKIVLKEIELFSGCTDKVMLQKEFVNKLQSNIIAFSNEYFDKNYFSEQIINSYKNEQLNLKLIILIQKFLLDIDHLSPNIAMNYFNNVLIMVEKESSEDIQLDVYASILESFKADTKVYKSLVNYIIRTKRIGLILKLVQNYSIDNQDIMNHILKKGKIEDIFQYVFLHPKYKEEIFKYVSENAYQIEIQNYVINSNAKNYKGIINIIGEYYSQYGDALDIKYFVNYGKNIENDICEKIENKLIGFNMSIEHVITFAINLKSDNALCAYFLSLNPSIRDIFKYALNANINKKDIKSQQEILCTAFEKKYLEDKDNYFQNAEIIFNYAESVEGAPISQLEDLAIKTKNVLCITEFSQLKGSNTNKLGAAYLKYRKCGVNKNFSYDQQRNIEEFFIYKIYENCSDLEVTMKIMDVLMKKTNNKNYELISLVSNRSDILKNEAFIKKINNYYSEFSEQEKNCLFSDYNDVTCFPSLIVVLNDFSKMKYLRYFNHFGDKIEYYEAKYNFLFNYTFDISPVKFINFIMQMMDNNYYEIFIYGAIKQLKETRLKNGSEQFLQVFWDFLVNPKENIDKVDDLIKEYSILVNQEFTEPVMKLEKNKSAEQKLVLENKEN